MKNINNYLDLLKKESPILKFKPKFGNLRFEVYQLNDQWILLCHIYDDKTNELKLDHLVFGYLSNTIPNSQNDLTYYSLIEKFFIPHHEEHQASFDLKSKKSLYQIHGEDISIKDFILYSAKKELKKKVECL